MTLKPNWLSLMNSSVETLPFEAKMNKARILLDPTYIKFLPLILKKINKNRLFDKIVEDSSQDPSYERLETPDDKYTKNIFSDTRNWMRMPTSRLYTIEYKTSPIIYFKNPTRNIDHFTKVRRIRDYQRVMNYVDKMINEKVTLGSTAPMLKTSRAFYNEPQIDIYTTPMTKIKSNVIKKQSTNNKTKHSYIKTFVEDKKIQCRCHKRISILIDKLIRSLQKILPDFTNDQMQTPSPCNSDRNKTESKSMEQTEMSRSTLKPLQYDVNIPSSNSTTSDTFIEFTSTDFRSSQYQNNYEITKSTETTDYTSTNAQSASTMNNEYKESSNNNAVPKTTPTSESYRPKIDYTLSSIIELLRPNWRPSKTFDKFNKNITTTTTNQFIEGTEVDSIYPQNTTKPMTLMTTTTKTSLNTLTTIRNLPLAKNNTNGTISKSSTESKNYDNDIYEDYIDTTTNSLHHYKILDIHSMELLKSKLLVPKHKEKYNKMETYDEVFIKPLNDETTHDSEREYNNKTWNLLNQMGQLLLSTALPKISDLDNVLQENTINITEFMTEKYLDESNTATTASTSKQRSIEENWNKYKQQQKTEDITFEEETDKASLEEITSEKLRSLETLINKLNDTEILNKTLEGNSSELYEWEHINIEEIDDNITQSMIPDSKSSYLEIRRGEWKQDEPQEYDNNINNYFFD